MNSKNNTANKNSENSTYTKFFRFAFIVVCVCVAASAILINAFSSRLYKNEKFTEIEGVSALFISGLEHEYSLTNSMCSGNISNLHQSFVRDYNINFFVYDEHGNCMLHPTSEQCDPMKDSVKQQLDSGAILKYESTHISEKAQSIFYGRRFIVQYGQNEPKTCYLAAYMPSDDIDTFSVKLFASTAIVMIICILPAYFALKARAQKNLTDANEFLRVVQQYAKGDFDEQIVISSPGNLQEIAQYVNALADNIKNSDETGKTFIANVSHELRTPITTISGFVDGILDGTIPKSSQQEYLHLVSKETKRLKVLITSMLNMSRYESGTLKPNFTETNLTELVVQTVLMFEKKINNKKLEIEGLDSDRLMAVVDPNLIQQVIYNLVENAVKFVNPGGTLTFIFSKEDNMCNIGLRNTGEGLKNDEIQQVFDRFYKTDSSRGKDTSGLGLGLAISRKLVHLHNGKIIVRSIYGEYTEFTIQLPEQQNSD